MELVRYIHLNPIRAGLVQDMKGLNRWLWSGHSALVGRVKRSWQNIDCVLALFGDGRLAKENYLKFVLKGINQGRRPELVGGGLIRSIGGWSEVLALRKRRDKEASDPRVLGDAQFVSRLLSKEEPLTESASSRRKGMELPQIAERICRVHGITLCELRSGSRRPEIVEARRVVSWIGIKTLGYAGADIARYLGVTNSCVTRAASRGKPEHLESYIG
jgi:hypothetical protein